MTDPRPLDGVKVLDLSRMYPGAMCTLLLADLGADVVKVEAPGAGDGLRMITGAGGFAAAHVALNRGKRSVGLDLRNPAGPDVLRRLIAWADVVVESHRPGQLDERGVGYEATRADKPGLVWCSITGFGSTGPNAQATGHDLTFIGYAGLLDRLGDGPSTPPATTLSLPLAASHAALGIVAALLSGRGGRVDADMTDSAMWVLAEDVARAANAPSPGYGTFSARNVYVCADGREVTVAATEPRTWAALCAALDADDLAGHRFGVDDDGPVLARLTAAFASRPAADWVRSPGLAGGVGPVHTADELVDDQQVTARGSLVPLADGSGVRVFAGPLRIDGEVATAALAPPPELGAHTDEVLAAVGYRADDIDALRRDGVIA